MACCASIAPIRCRQLIYLLGGLADTFAQSYFRETALPPVLCALLQFPISIDIQTTASQEFALQFWDDQKRANTSLILGIMGMLVASKGHGVSSITMEMRPFLNLTILGRYQRICPIQGASLRWLWHRTRQRRLKRR